MWELFLQCHILSTGGNARIITGTGIRASLQKLHLDNTGTSTTLDSDNAKDLHEGKDNTGTYYFKIPCSLTKQ
jgi:hypothetical protein